MVAERAQAVFIRLLILPAPPFLFVIFNALKISCLIINVIIGHFAICNSIREFIVDKRLYH